MNQVWAEREKGCVKKTVCMHMYVMFSFPFSHVSLKLVIDADGNFILSYPLSSGKNQTQCLSALQGSPEEKVLESVLPKIINEKSNLNVL